MSLLINWLSETGVSKERLAVEAGVSWHTIEGLRNGRRGGSYETLRKITRAMNKLAPTRPVALDDWGDEADGQGAE